MKKKLIASLISAAVVTLMIMPAAFAAPSTCPLQNTAATNTTSKMNQLLGTNSTQSTCPKTAAIQSLLNGAKTSNTASTCPKTAALNNLVNGTGTSPTTMQQLLEKFGLNLNCTTGNCTSGNCPTGNCATGNCTTGNCTTGNCTTGNCTTGNCTTGNCLTTGCATGTCPNK